MKTYLLLEANYNSLLFAKQFISLLHGTRNNWKNNPNPVVEGSHVIVPVIVDKGEQTTDKITRKFKEYIEIRPSLLRYGYCLFDMEEPIVFDYKESGTQKLNDACSFLIQTNKYLCEAYKFQQTLARLKVDGGDKIVTLVSTDNFGQNNYALGLAALTFDKCEKNTIICQLNSDLGDVEKQLIDIASEHIIITGNIDKSKLSSGFVSLQSAASALDVILSDSKISGYARSHKDENVLNYTNNGLHSSISAYAVDCVSLISLFMDEMEDSSALKSLKKRLQLSDQLWSRSTTRDSFAIIKDNYDSWVTSTVGFEKNQVDVNKIIAKLNKVDKLSNTADLNHKISSLCQQIGECEEFFPDYRALGYDNFDKDNQEVIANDEDSLSPSSIFEYNNNAFKTDDSIISAMLRSACLDCWEQYFKTHQQNKFDKQSLDTLSKLLSITTIGKDVISHQPTYSGVLNNDITWITSPLSGFAVQLSETYCSTNELQTRSLDFRKFMLSFINLFPNNFSEDFRNYVTDNANGVLDMESLSVNAIFKTFKDFRKFKLDITK